MSTKPQKHIVVPNYVDWYVVTVDTESTVWGLCTFDE
jgi:hypothetical protein